MLHNIGRLALDQQRPRELYASHKLAQRDGITIPEAQRQVLGFTDAELGGALARHWNFPESIVHAVERHHLDVNALTVPESLEAFVARARLFARAQGISDGYETADTTTPPPAEWSTGRIQHTLRESGGVEGIMERVSAFMQSTTASQR